MGKRERAAHQGGFSGQAGGSLSPPSVKAKFCRVYHCQPNLFLDVMLGQWRSREFGGERSRRWAALESMRHRYTLNLAKRKVIDSTHTSIVRTMDFDASDQRLCVVPALVHSTIFLAQALY